MSEKSFAFASITAAVLCALFLYPDPPAPAKATADVAPPAMQLAAPAILRMAPAVAGTSPHPQLAKPQSGVRTAALPVAVRAGGATTR